MTPGDRTFMDGLARLSVGGVTPSYAQLKAELGLASISQVARRVGALERRGVLYRRPGRGRRVELIATGTPEFPLRDIAEAVAHASELVWRDENRPLRQDEAAAVISHEWRRVLEAGG